SKKLVVQTRQYRLPIQCSGLRRDLWLGRLALLPSMHGLSFDGRSVSAQSRMMEQVARMPSV
ncbi:hypothetical protein J6590_107852, partial [Homalodisca vitripennis]